MLNRRCSLKIFGMPFKGKIRRLFGIGLVLAVLLAGAAVEFFLKPSKEVSIGEHAKKRVASYEWHNSAHQILLVDDPVEAFMLRRQMIREANRSIDLCTFLWRDDETGLTLLQDLIAAAERGVRVRLLGDGVFFMRNPSKVAAMAQASKRLEVRLYNPVNQQVASIDVGILENLMLDFSSVNQRLHLKIFTVDGRQTLIGGRNVGNEYFGVNKKLNFIDRDILIKGPAVADAVDAFELFWKDSRSKTAMKLDDVAASIPDMEWLQQAPQESMAEVDEATGRWRSVNRISIWYDRPGLIGDQPDYNPQLLADRLAALVGSAEHSVIIETPYLVLSDRSHALFKNLRSEKPDLPIRVLTNSLASTDAWQTYVAFQPQLRIMLGDLRLLLHLKKPDTLVERSGNRDTTSSLHSKTSIIDSRFTAIGSFNWDPRSGVWNAEVMVVIDDKSLATDLSEYLQPLWSPEGAWVVAELEQPIGLEQIDTVGSTVHTTISEIIGINLWPLTNTACFEWKGGKVVSPYDPEFHKYYRPVGSYPQVSFIDQKRILTNLLQPISRPFTPTL